MAPGQDDFFRYFVGIVASFCYSTLSVYAAVCRGDFISDDRITDGHPFYMAIWLLCLMLLAFLVQRSRHGKHVFGIRDSAGTRRNQGLF